MIYSYPFTNTLFSHIYSLMSKPIYSLDKLVQHVFDNAHECNTTDWGDLADLSHIRSQDSLIFVATFFLPTTNKPSPHIPLAWKKVMKCFKG